MRNSINVMAGDILEAVKDNGEITIEDLASRLLEAKVGTPSNMEESMAYSVSKNVVASQVLLMTQAMAMQNTVRFDQRTGTLRL